MKVRFDGLDVTAMVAHLQRVVLGRRVVNLYDGDSSGNNDTVVLKLDGDPKTFLTLQSGIRFHDTSNFKAEVPMPTPFCAKIRKHLRGLRLEKIQQIGQDRVVLFTFLGGKGGKHHLILELYAKGNLILTDGDYRILALLRTHVYQGKGVSEKDADDADPLSAQDPEKVAVQVGRIYPATYAAAVDDANFQDGSTSGVLSEGVVEWVTEQLQQTANNKKVLNLKTMLLRNSSGVSHYGPALLEHCILFAHLEPHRSLSDYPLSVDDYRSLQSSLRSEAQAVTERLQEAATTQTPGYLLYKDREMEEDEVVGHQSNLPHPDKILEEFQPHLLKQHEKRNFIETIHFGKAVDDFFRQLNAQKMMLKAQAAKQTVQAKLDKIKQDQADGLDALQKEQEEMKLRATAVEQQAEQVDQVLVVINSALDSGMDWDQLEQLIAIEQEQQNPVASLIEELHLEEEAMTIRLPIDPFDPESEETLLVRISLKDSAHSNASNLFAKYRASKEKSQKTIEATTKAFKAAEETAERQLAEAQRKGKQIFGVTRRKPGWYEKFHWFVTTDNYLVLGGKDAHQNEMLVKRYLRPGDAYLHADVHGASSCILRAKRRRLKNGRTVPVPLSDQALREAGNFTICLSSAWSSKLVTSAWWVEAHQVSKTAPTGEYLTVGSFMVRGKKNFLPPTQLEMGLGVLFRLGDDDSILRHKNERRDFALMQLEELSENDEDEPLDHHTKDRESKKAEEVVLENVDQTDEEVEDDAMDAVTASSQYGEESNEDSSTPKTTIKRRGLSARDRKLVKKYGSLEEAEKVLNACEARSENPDDVASNTGSEPAAVDNFKRGKKSKLKRMKKKYADQDEEDRELALLLLQGGEKEKRGKGGSKQKNLHSEGEKSIAAATEAVLSNDSASLALQLPETVRSALEKCLNVDDRRTEMPKERWNVLEADILEQLVSLEPEAAQLAAVERLNSLNKNGPLENVSASLAGVLRTIRKYGHENLGKDRSDAMGAGSPRKASGWKQILEEEGIPEGDLDDEDDAGDDSAELSKLTGKPTTLDSLLYCVPVLAPYPSLSQYTFRVKITPGNMKRGKAAKQCLEVLLKGDGAKSVEGADIFRELIKMVGDDDWVHTLISDVKISSAGASKLAKKQKAKSRH